MIYNSTTALPASEKFRKGFLCLLTASAVIGSGLGYGKVYLFHLVLVVTSLYSCYHVFSQKKWNKFKIALPLLALLAFMGLSVVWAPSLSMAIKEVAIVCLGIALMINLLFLVEDKSDLILILKTTAVLFTLSCGIGLFEMTFGINWPWSRNSPWLYLLGRDIFLSHQKFVSDDIELIRHSPTAFFWNPNNLAVFVTCFFPFIIFSKQKKWVVLATTALMLLIILGAGARMCFWVLMLFTPFLLIFYRKRIHAITTAVLCFALFFISLNVFVWRLPIPMFNQFKLPYGELVFGEPKLDDRGKPIKKLVIAEEENSISFRKEMIERTFTLFLKKPVLGVGPGGIEHEFTVHKTKSGLVDLHFFWLELLVNYGLLWFVSLLAGIAYLAWKAWKKNTILSLSVLFSVALFFPCVVALSSAIYYLPGYLLFASLILCSLIPATHESADLR